MNEHSNKSADFTSNDLHEKLTQKIGLDYSSTCKGDMLDEGRRRRRQGFTYER